MDIQLLDQQNRPCQLVLEKVQLLLRMMHAHIMIIIVIIIIIIIIINIRILEHIHVLHKN